jgi:hypothetical protein
MSQSIAQKIYEFMDNNPESKPRHVKEEFPEINPITVEGSIKRWRKELKNKCSNMGIVSEQTSLTDISYSVLMETPNLKDGVGKNDSNAPKVMYPKIAKKYQIKEDSGFHIIPLIKSFKLLPLYIFLKTHEIIKQIRIKDYSVVEIISGIIDLINMGNYKSEDIADFTLNNNRELKGFLGDDSWKRSCIIDVNDWIGLTHSYYRGSYEYKYKNLKQIEFYRRIRGDIITKLLPSYYSIFLYKRKKKYINRDLAKAVLIHNQSSDKPVSLSDIVDKYNSELEYRNREKYQIDLGYSEKSWFMKGTQTEEQKEGVSRRLGHLNKLIGLDSDPTPEGITEIKEPVTHSLTCIKCNKNTYGISKEYSEEHKEDHICLECKNEHLKKPCLICREGCLKEDQICLKCEYNFLLGKKRKLWENKEEFIKNWEEIRANNPDIKFIPVH